jgi:hypothetical protein
MQGEKLWREVILRLSAKLVEAADASIALAGMYEG